MMEDQKIRLTALSSTDKNSNKLGVSLLDALINFLNSNTDTGDSRSNSYGGTVRTNSSTSSKVTVQALTEIHLQQVAQNPLQDQMQKVLEVLQGMMANL